MIGFRYFRPASLTWWAGALAIALGVAYAMQWPGDDSALSGLMAVLAEVLLAMNGGGAVSPAALITLGLGIIGAGDKLERHQRKAELMLDAQHSDLRDVKHIAAVNDVQLQQLAANITQGQGPGAAVPMDDGPDPDEVAAGIIDPWGPGGSR